ncbi:MAG: hypothetical protein AVDCRST_MAG30-68, partial [uncultured Solirubrobacteraceae bacterium]
AARDGRRRRGRLHGRPEGAEPQPRPPGGQGGRGGRRRPGRPGGARRADPHVRDGAQPERGRRHRGARDPGQPRAEGRRHAGALALPGRRGDGRHGDQHHGVRGPARLGHPVRGGRIADAGRLPGGPGDRRGAGVRVVPRAGLRDGDRSRARPEHPGAAARQAGWRPEDGRRHTHRLRRRVRLPLDHGGPVRPRAAPRLHPPLGRRPGDRRRLPAVARPHDHGRAARRPLHRPQGLVQVERPRQQGQSPALRRLLLRPLPHEDRGRDGDHPRDAAPERRPLHGAPELLPQRQLRDPALLQALAAGVRRPAEHGARDRLPARLDRRRDRRGPARLTGAADVPGRQRVGGRDEAAALRRAGRPTRGSPGPHHRAADRRRRADPLDPHVPAAV